MSDGAGGQFRLRMCTGSNGWLRCWFTVVANSLHTYTRRSRSLFWYSILSLFSHKHFSSFEYVSPVSVILSFAHSDAIATWTLETSTYARSPPLLPWQLHSDNFSSSKWGQIEPADCSRMPVSPTFLRVPWHWLLCHMWVLVGFLSLATEFGTSFQRTSGLDLSPNPL